MDSISPDILRSIISGRHSTLMVHVNKRLRSVFLQPLREWMLEIQKNRRELHACGERLMHRYCQPRQPPIRTTVGTTLTSFNLIMTKVSDDPTEFDARLVVESAYNHLGPFFDLTVEAYPRTPTSGILDVRYQTDLNSMCRRYVHVEVGYVRGITAAFDAIGIV
jgi:hypothetical protein